MANKTKFKNYQTFRRELLQTAHNLLEKFNKIEIALTEKLYPLEKDHYHFISKILKTDFKNRTEYMFMSLLFKDIYKVETLSAKSGQISFLFAINLIKNLLKSEIDLSSDDKVFKEWDTVVTKIKTKFENSSCVAKESDIEETIREVCQDDILSDVCFEAIKTAGLEGKIFIENSKNASYIIEAKDGYSFGLKPYGFFLKNGTWEATECKVLTVDGFVENISEIDQLLNAAFDKKQPFVIIAQGFSEEVVSTLYTNFQKGTLNAVPIRIKTDLNNINIVNDVSIVCGMEPISSLKGQMLTFVKWDELPVISKILVTNSKTTIENSKTRAGVSNQIRMLLEKREDRTVVEDVQDLLDARIKNLTANSVTLNLPNFSTIKNDEQRVKLDNALRQTKTILNYGLLDKKKVEKEFENPSSLLENIVYKTILETMKKDKYPLLSVYLPVFVTGRTILMLLTASGRVEFDIT